MAVTLVKTLFTQTPKENVKNVTVSGWVRTMRESKAFAFVELNDGTYFRNLQVVLEEGRLNNYRQIVKSISVGAAVEFTGEIELTPEMKQPFELKADAATLVGGSPSDYPLQKKRHTLEYLRTIQHLRPRANLFQCAFRVRSVAAQAIHRFFHDQGYLLCAHAPDYRQRLRGRGRDVPGDHPGRGQSSPHGGRRGGFQARISSASPSSLTVSGQLNAEIFAMAFRNVYTFGPTFRAENSYTPRHAAEFWMIEPEIAFADPEGGHGSAGGNGEVHHLRRAG